MAWRYMNQQLDPNELPTMQELLTGIDENGGTDAALARLRDEQHEKYHNELIWRYPISQGDSAGGFIMPTREGILWIPYDEIEKDAGEILRTKDATIMDEETCAQLRDDFRRYTDEMCAALKDCARICRKIGRGKYIEEIIDLGPFEMVSDRMAVSDPCYDTDVWCRGELSNVLPGIWEASVVKRDEGDWGQRVARLIAVHEDYVESDIEATENAEFEVGVDSGQAGLFDCSHYRDDRVIIGFEKNIDKNDLGALWYMHCCHITLTQMAAGSCHMVWFRPAGLETEAITVSMAGTMLGKSSVLKSNTSRRRKMMANVPVIIHETAHGAYSLGLVDSILTSFGGDERDAG